MARSDLVAVLLACCCLLVATAADQVAATEIDGRYVDWPEMVDLLITA